MPRPSASLPTPWRNRPRINAFAAALLGAATLHALIVSGGDDREPAFGPRLDGRIAAFNVRAVVVPPRVAPAETEAIAPASPAPSQVLAATVPMRSPAHRSPSASRGAVKPALEPEPAPPAQGAPSTDDGAPDTPISRAKPTPGASSSDASVESAPAGAPRMQEIPLYATRIPPAATLNYRLRRGTLQGQAELRWQRADERYEAQLLARVAGAPLFRLSSEGGLDARGLAPERFTDQRARRGTRAISFQRESGRVSFSAVPAVLELGQGMQDRLSWIVQLAAVASVNPERLAAGGEIVLMIVGMRGETVPWRFVSLGAVEAGDANTPPPIHLQRLAASTYDTSVDVWLDPQPPHWPVRAQWRNGPTDVGLELWRIEAAETR